MRVFSITELLRLTRRELTDLATQITVLLDELPDGSSERVNALTNLHNIRVVLARHGLTP